MPCRLWAPRCKKEAKEGLIGQIRTRDLEPSSWGTSGEGGRVQRWTRLDTAGRVLETPEPSSLNGRVPLTVVQRSQCPAPGLPPSRLTSPEACRTRISASRTCIEALHHHNTPATICTTTTVLRGLWAHRPRSVRDGTRIHPTDACLNEEGSCYQRNLTQQHATGAGSLRFSVASQDDGGRRTSPFFHRMLCSRRPCRQPEWND